MKKFLIYSIVWLILVLVSLEIALRVFGLSAKTMPTQNIDNNYLFEPGNSGFRIKGGLKEINCYYEINKQGFNSIVDFDELDYKNLNIALIGDSYIQGFDTDVNHSIGRQLEEMLGKNVVVHEYGRAGANIIDYALAYQQFVKSKKYDFVFVLATDKDLEATKPSYMGQGKRVPKQSLIRKVYDNIHVVRYLNINQGLGVHFNKLINDGPESIDRIHNENLPDEIITKESYLATINQDALKLLPKEVVFLYEEDRMNDFFVSTYDYNFKKVIHFKLPKDHGLDAHWNINGRYNCAKAMAEYIQLNK
jgi:hypothetical protein